MRTRHYVARAAAVALVASVAACSGGSAASVSRPPASVTPTASPTPVPKPTPTVLTIAQAAQLYLKIVKGPNADLIHANTFIGHAQSLSTYRYWGKRLQRDLHTEAIRLRATRWPVNVRPVAARLADQDATLVADLQDMAMAASNDDAVSSWDRTAADTGKSAGIAEQMRELLGLPPAS